MIKNQGGGWCSFDLKTFHGTPSYLTDVPVDLLDAFINYHSSEAGAAWFDEEGSEFTFIITPYSVFIVEEKDGPVLHDFSDIDISGLEKELIGDIEKDLDGWADFLTCGIPEDVTRHREEIEKKLAALKGIRN